MGQRSYPTSKLFFDKAYLRYYKGSYFFVKKCIAGSKAQNIGVNRHFAGVKYCAERVSRGILSALSYPWRYNKQEVDCLVNLLFYLPLYVFIVRSGPMATNERMASPKSFRRSGINFSSSSEKSPNT